MAPPEQPAAREERALDLCVAQRDNMRAIFDSVEDGIFTVGADLRLSNANRAFLRMLGLAEPQALGTDPGTLLALTGAPIDDVLRRTLAGETIRGLDVEITPPGDGPRLQALLSTAPLRDRDHDVGGAVVVLHDVTRLRALEDDLRLAYGHGGLVGANWRMREIYHLIDNLADNDVTVLITGESGTGKELVAAAIHQASHRAAAPFVAVNCAALSETILESELFGHVKGAFTGAIRDRVGRFEAAAGGTIFLDEIGSVSEVVQQRLLRVLQERQFERLGDSTTRRVDVRVIAATNVDLRQRVQEGRFREDLYFRLHVVEIDLPPLRERREDIPLLAAHLLDRHRERMGRGPMTLSADALAALMAYPWEGNVRQLENAILRALVVARGRSIQRSHLPPEVLRWREEPAAAVSGGSAPGEAAPASAGAADTDEDEAAELRRALAEAGGRHGRAAAILGIHRTTLWRRLRKHGLSP